MIEWAADNSLPWLVVWVLLVQFLRQAARAVAGNGQPG